MGNRRKAWKTAEGDNGMNVYEKLNEARIKLQSANIKKSGNNKFVGYTYYELADILPCINQIAKDLKFTCVISFGTDVAQLEFIDLEKPTEKICFLSPMSKAALRGCHEVQNLGAVETYIKRYLYQNCFEIVENDVLDSTMNPAESGNNRYNGNGYNNNGYNNGNYNNGGYNR